MSTPEKPEKKEDIIVSKRTFGIEIEAGTTDPDDVNRLHESMRGVSRVTTDSSIKLPFGVEIVTPVLSGSNGAKLVIKICDKLKKLNFTTDHISCGMHVHLDGQDFMEQEEVVCIEGEVAGFLRKRKYDLKSLFFIAKEAIYNSTPKKLETPAPFIGIANYLKSVPNQDMGEVFDTYGQPLSVKRDLVDFEGIEQEVLTIAPIDKYDRQIAKLYLDKENEIDKINFSKEKKRLITEGQTTTEALSSHKLKLTENLEKYTARLRELVHVDEGRYVAKLYDPRPLARVKTLMYFYVAFNEVIQGMVAPSRRIGNSYCMPIREFFTLEQIDGLTKYSEFEALWYKNGDPKKIQRFKGDHYNDSRYLDINLHSLFNRTGTIEIRLHGSSKDPNQILLWTALHQRIVDRISEQSITVEQIKEALRGKTTLVDKCEAMIELADLSECLAKYTRRLLAHFSDLTLE